MYGCERGIILSKLAFTSSFAARQPRKIVTTRQIRSTAHRWLKIARSSHMPLA
jgi:hypothetical protein